MKEAISILSHYGHLRVELSEIVKIELTGIQPKAGYTARYARYLFITTDDGNVYTLQLKTEKKEALKLKEVE